MNIVEEIDKDLKAAMLSGDKTLTTTLRGIKSAILYAEVAAGKRQEGLEEKQLIDILGKEAKKRQESADLYEKGGNSEKAEAELVEKAVIEKYLPAQLSDGELEKIVENVIKQSGATDTRAMGQVIGLVKQQVEGQADGGRIAALVKKRLGA